MTERSSGKIIVRYMYHGLDRHKIKTNNLLNDRFQHPLSTRQVHRVSFYSLVHNTRELLLPFNRNP